MSTDQTAKESLKGRLFSDEELHAYAVLDGASVPGLRLKLYDLEPEHVCLYRGELDPDMEEAAPYLVKLEQDSEFMQWVLDEGWGNHWGIFALTPATLRDMRTHFRKFLIVHDSQGKPLYFRYYDPRVLRLFLPTCTAEDLQKFFGPVSFFLAENEDGKAPVQFYLKSGRLQQGK